MRQLTYTTLFIIVLSWSCTSSEKLTYLNNLPESGEVSYFTMEIPEYKIQVRDILYITIKAMTPDGMISDFLATSRGGTGANFLQSESGQYMYGYDVNRSGDIILPVIGTIHIEGLSLDSARLIIQEKANVPFPGSVAECKLLSFKFTVIGEVKTPGAYINYNNYLTVFEAIGRAGGVGDFGQRNKVKVIRAVEKGSKTFELNLQDKDILNSEAYFLLPNDVVIVEPYSKKVFNLNLPTYTFFIVSITSVLTTTLLLIDYFK